LRHLPEGQLQAQQHDARAQQSAQAERHARTGSLRRAEDVVIADAQQDRQDQRAERAHAGKGVKPEGRRGNDAGQDQPRHGSGQRTVSDRTGMVGHGLPLLTWGKV
jgi:hypothetical protein